VEYKNYIKKAVQPMRPYIPGEDLKGISVSEEDTPEEGGMIVVNPKNPADKWYVAKDFFQENYVEVDNIPKIIGSKKGKKVEFNNDFSWALATVKFGHAIQRKGWNGKGLKVKFFYPDKNDKMTLPYLYIEYPNDAAITPGARVPWLASQTDILADDWGIADNG
jgi:hypothetical protein